MRKQQDRHLDHGRLEDRLVAPRDRVAARRCDVHTVVDEIEATYRRALAARR